MKTSHSSFRFLLPVLCAGSLALVACGKDDGQDNPPAPDSAATGTVTWTCNGTACTSTVYSSAVVSGTDEITVTGSSADRKMVVSLGLRGIATRGVGAYELRQGSVLDSLPAGELLLDASGGQGAAYNTRYGPAASNGTVAVSQYDPAGQKLSGTFSFTAGALPDTGASGTQTVTSGSFSFTRFR